MKALLWYQCCVLESQRLMDDFEEKKVYLAEEIGPTDPLVSGMRRRLLRLTSYSFLSLFWKRNE